MNTGTTQRTLRVLWALLCREAAVHSFKPIIINTIVWSTTLLIPFTFFMHKLGLPKDFGLFFLPAGAASWGFFDIMGNSTMLVSDITGDKAISYDLSLPIPQWMIFVKLAIASAYRALIPSFFILGWGLSFLYIFKGMVPVEISLLKVLLVYPLVAIFYGFFGLVAASFMPTVSDVRHLWMRFLMPLWWLAGFTYNWKTVYSVAPKFALFTLIDPIVYVMEAVRSSVLGADNFLPFWPSIGMIVFYTIIFGVIAVKRLKVRLDCL